MISVEQYELIRNLLSTEKGQDLGNGACAQLRLVPCLSGEANCRDPSDRYSKSELHVHILLTRANAISRLACE